MPHRRSDRVITFTIPVATLPPLIAGVAAAKDRRRGPLLRRRRGARPPLVARDPHGQSLCSKAQKPTWMCSLRAKGPYYTTTTCGIDATASRGGAASAAAEASFRHGEHARVREGRSVSHESKGGE